MKPLIVLGDISPSYASACAWRDISRAERPLRLFRPYASGNDKAEPADTDTGAPLGPVHPAAGRADPGTAATPESRLEPHDVGPGSFGGFAIINGSSALRNPAMHEAF